MLFDALVKMVRGTWNVNIKDKRKKIIVCFSECFEGKIINNFQKKMILLRSFRKLD